MGATSYLSHQRIDRPRTQKSYKDWVESFIAAQGHTQDEVLPKTEQVVENIMMGLRLQPGISLTSVYEVFGEVGLKALSKAIAPHIQSHWVIVDAKSENNGANITNLKPNDRIRLSDPEGFLMSNVVIIDAFNALEPLSCIN